MESSELYHVKQQFVLGKDIQQYHRQLKADVTSGAYKSLVNLTLPDTSLPDYIPTLIYKARAYIALDDPKAAIKIIPASENVSLKAVAALAKYVDAADASAKETSLEELRDLCVEIDDGDVEGEEKDKDLVRVLAGTAFARAGEVEEALETLGAGTDTENLEACVKHTYLLHFSWLTP